MVFIACALCFCLLAGTVAAIAVMVEWDFYTMPETEVMAREFGFYNVSDGSVVWPDEEGLAEYIAGDPELRLMARFFHIAYSLRYWIFAIGAAALIGSVALFITLMHVSGRRAGDDELHPGPLFPLPFDLLAVLAVAAAGILFAVYFDVFWYGIGDAAAAIAACALALILLNMGLGLCMSLASRAKQHVLFKNMLICIVFRLFWKILRGVWQLVRRLFGSLAAVVRGIPLTWRTLALMAVIAFLEFVTFVSLRHNIETWLFFWSVERFILTAAALYLALCLRNLLKGAAALSMGDMSYRTDTSRMHWDLKRAGEYLNNISSGMAIAVEDRLRSERMKTELITNVSHDIKTPLTSIINYSDLIEKELESAERDEEKLREYAAVLSRQSQRLRRLTDDLVEASKASTGNLEVDLLPCDASVCVTQASGEYTDRLEASGLTLVAKAPDKPVIIMADGRRMQRIFDNLFSNICKYAQPGTRVYLSLESSGGLAKFSFKNTSRDALDIPAEELLERFTRGDASRSTEGSGLGLSIARSLAELQGGSLELSIDGDLFKAALSFPEIR